MVNELQPSAATSRIPALRRAINILLRLVAQK
jgi:hypothetical protein